MLGVENINLIEELSIGWVYIIWMSIPIAFIIQKSINFFKKTKLLFRPSYNIVAGSLFITNMLLLFLMHTFIYFELSSYFYIVYSLGIIFCIYILTYFFKIYIAKLDLYK
ncbi:MAG: Unknown protein [uncultured Sulfurovum sp.]|uniref:Uncharacterized protein n=1 Tax=uncultured Sulfurovum sp. TaxID=269237 RepID=A0A6S6SRC6_9BACT|nr:MAG: Unknown protein [uncultured Sulfurovum sp.]